MQTSISQLSQDIDEKSYIGNVNRPLTPVSTESKNGGSEIVAGNNDFKANNFSDPEPGESFTVQNVPELEPGEKLAIQNEIVEDLNIVDWDSPTDPDNPMNWPSWRRWTLISLVNLITLLAGLSSSMFAPGVPALMAEFHSTNSTLASFVVTVFVLGFATGPLLFAPLSELYGRSIVQHVGCVGFVLFSIACALSTGLNMLIGMRLLQGIFAAVPLTNGGAIVADMIRQENRGFAMAMLTLGVLLGPVIGPVTGGFLSSAKGWRWVFWLIAEMLGVLTLLCFFFWRESYAPVLLERKASRLRRETGNMALRSRYDNGLSPSKHLKRGIGRAVKMLIFSPIVLSLSVYMGVIYSYFYLLFTTFTPIFEEYYHFSPSTVGLSYLGVGIGFIIGQASSAKLGDMILSRLTVRFGHEEMKPEYRLPLCCIGALFIPVALFWYGWSVAGHVHWIMPIVGTGFLGCGNALIFISIQAYIVDAFTLYAASALAANTLTRSVMAATLPLAAPKMYQTLGLGWGNSLLAFLSLIMIPVPYLLMVHGEKMRKLNVERIKNL